MRFPLNHFNHLCKVNELCNSFCQTEILRKGWLRGKTKTKRKEKKYNSTKIKNIRLVHVYVEQQRKAEQ